MAAAKAGSGRSRRAPSRPGWSRCHLSFRPPLAWECQLDFHRARLIDGVEEMAGRRYRRVLEVDDRPVALEVWRGGPRHLVLAVQPGTPHLLAAVAARVRRAFDLDAEPARIDAHLADDPLLAPLVAQRPGLRVSGSLDPFEQGVRAILGQQVSVVAARRLAARLVERWGRPVRFPDLPGLRAAFPAATALVDADVASLGMPRARARAVNDFAAAVVADGTLLEAAPDLEQSLARLRALRGLGDWSAHYIALRALREPDAFPAGDVALLRALPGADGLRLTVPALNARAERWRPFRAYAAQHLWSHDAGAPG